MKLTLSWHPGLHVGECVPLCHRARSVMQYLIRQANHRNLSSTVLAQQGEFASPSETLDTRPG